MAGLPRIPFFLFRRRRGRLRLGVVEPAASRWTRSQVLLLPLTGLVNVGGADAPLSPPGMLATLKDRLLAATGNARLKAVILRIDSPGGEVTASDLIHRELLEFKRKRKLPLIAWLGSMATSGGLYIAMAADEIYALPTTVTGSIGVITMLPGLHGLGEKLGVEMRVIKSGENKDLGSPWRPLDEGQRRIFQDLIDNMNQRFREVVLEGRGAKGLTAERLGPLADGRILDAQAALAGGLIDGIKYPGEIVARARELAGVGDAKLVAYDYAHRPPSNLYAQAQEAWGGVNAWPGPWPGAWPELAALADPRRLGALAGGATDPVLSRPGFFYLWQP